MGGNTLFMGGDVKYVLYMAGCDIYMCYIHDDMG